VTNVPTTISCRVGVDLSSVSEVEAAVRAQGDRYLQRVFTANELKDCRRPAGFSMESLAARFSAKEATIKVLQPPAQQPAWSAMEVLRRADGSCVMALSGTAAQLAEDAGIASLSLSMTHDGDQAAAVVFALCGSTLPTELSLAVCHHAGEELKFTPWRYAGSADG
jgi:holo-[acyl-carrier protein] synthase